MSSVTNEGVMMCCKAVRAKFLTVVYLLVKPSTFIAKPMGFIEASLYIIQTPVTVTFSSPVISSSLSSSLFSAVC